MVKGKMKAGLVFTLAMLMCIAFAGSAFATDWATKTHSAGSVSLGLQGGLTYTGGDSKTTTFRLGSSMDYFLSTGLALGLNVGGSYTMQDERTVNGVTYGGDSGTFNFLGKITYYFVSGSNVVPFIGLNGGARMWAGDGDTSTTWIVGAQAGVEFMISEDTSFTLAYAPSYYQDEQADKGQFQHNIEFGVIIYFD